MRRDHQLKRRAAQRKLNAIASWEVKESQGNGSKPEAPSREELLHLQIFKNIELVLRANEKGKRSKSRNVVRGFTEARAIAGAKDNEAASHKREKMDKRAEKSLRTAVAEYYFDYNTVEKVLLMSAILLCLCAIMFKSGKFDRLLSEEDVLMQGMLITFAGATIIVSLLYYMTVLVSEATGYLPSIVKIVCGHNKEKNKRRRARKSIVEMNSRRVMRTSSESLLNKNLELKTLKFQNNPLRGQLDKTQMEKQEMQKQALALREKNQKLMDRLRQAKKFESRRITKKTGRGSAKEGEALRRKIKKKKKVITQSLVEDERSQ